MELLASEFEVIVVNVLVKMLGIETSAIKIIVM